MKEEPQKGLRYKVIGVGQATGGEGGKKALKFAERLFLRLVVCAVCFLAAITLYVLLPAPNCLIAVFMLGAVYADLSDELIDKRRNGA